MLHPHPTQEDKGMIQGLCRRSGQAEDLHSIPWMFPIDPDHGMDMGDVIFPGN